MNTVPESSLPAGMVQLGAGSRFQETLYGLLEEVAILQGMPRRDLEALGKFLLAYSAKSGTVLFEEGHKSNFMCFLVKGTLQVDKERNLYEKRPLARILAGKSVGEMSMVDNMPHSATVKAEGDVTLLLMTRLGLERLREDHPRIAYDLMVKIAQILSFRLRQASGQLIDYL